MQTFLTIAAILGLTALFSYINERFLHMQQTIGLMLLALGFTLILALLNGLGLTSTFAGEQAFVTRLSLNETLLNGVLCSTTASALLSSPYVLPLRWGCSKRR